MNRKNKILLEKLEKVINKETVLDEDDFYYLKDLVQDNSDLQYNLDNYECGCSVEDFDCEDCGDLEADIDDLKKELKEKETYIFELEDKLAASTDHRLD